MKMMNTLKIPKGEACFSFLHCTDWNQELPGQWNRFDNPYQISVDKTLGFPSHNANLPCREASIHFFKGRKDQPLSFFHHCAKIQR